ncbi:MAG TPA: NAD-dependent epimerase/dehydratase family protein [Acidimicrobiales bacterium]|nr:NAD-dependent epimerase/dehydratase family protein [Acidimicrobiales bacterium]
MRVLVTGGAGFIGRQLVSRLLERGDEVTVVDLKARADEGVRHVQGDLRDPATTTEALADGTDAVVHLAALTRVLDSISDPDGVFRTNVLATHYLLERCRELEVPSFVFASTNAVVGDVGTKVIVEDMPLRPLTPYGATKAAAENLMSAYSAVYGLKTVALRFTNVYGRGMQVKDSVIARMMRAALSGGGIPIYGDGRQVRDYVYIADVVKAIELAVDLEASDTLVIGSGESFSVLELVDAACEATGRPIGTEHVPAKPGEMPAVIVDNSRAKSRGWVPDYDLPAGMKATWEDFLATSG